MLSFVLSVRYSTKTQRICKIKHTVKSACSKYSNSIQLTLVYEGIMFKTKINNYQMDRLISIMEANPKLMAGKLDSNFTREMMKELWDDITIELNSIGGTSKSAEKWRKCWADLKNRTKDRARKYRLHSLKTGDGPMLNRFMTPFEERILSLMQNAKARKQPDTYESGSSPDASSTNDIIEDMISSQDELEISETPQLHEKPQTSKSPHSSVTLIHLQHEIKASEKHVTTHSKQSIAAQQKPKPPEKTYQEELLEMQKQRNQLLEKQTVAMQTIASTMVTMSEAMYDFTVATKELNENLKQIVNTLGHNC